MTATDRQIVFAAQARDAIREWDAVAVEDAAYAKATDDKLRATAQVWVDRASGRGRKGPGEADLSAYVASPDVDIAQLRSLPVDDMRTARHAAIDATAERLRTRRADIAGMTDDQISALDKQTISALIDEAKALR